MYDEITVHYPLPDNPPINVFQTKDLECMLDDYTITTEGRLIHHVYTYECVDDPGSFVGYYMKIISAELVDTGYHGDLNFYNTDRDSVTGGHTWWEYVARFTDGTLQWIKRVEERPN